MRGSLCNLLAIIMNLLLHRAPTRRAQLYFRPSRPSTYALPAPPLTFPLLLLPFMSLSISALERLEPPDGSCYLGFSVGAGDTIAKFNYRMAMTPAVYVHFFHFPLSPEGRATLRGFLDEMLQLGAIACITLEPVEGLDAVSQEECADFGSLCASYEREGLPGIMIRFAHEMNGNWYPWCQQPILYRQKFRLIAAEVRSRTARTAMLWAPNNGVGYPFATNGLYQAAPGSPDFLELDTNRDGRLTVQDDMYAPYYPGDDVVDWVGMTIYHWGAEYPWLENELPFPHALANTLTGNGPEDPVPDFYARYCSDAIHHKPMVIPETSAFYNTEQPGANELAIKQAWSQQLFNISTNETSGPNIAVRFPKLKCINWFDHYKPELEARHQWIDWRVSTHPTIRAAFLRQVRMQRDGQPYFLTAQDLQFLQSSYAIAVESLPAILPLTGTWAISLRIRAQTPCDLVIDLLNQNFQWHGGTRVAVPAGTNIINTLFPIAQPLTDASAYRWSIFLTPTGRDYLSALAWLKWTQPIARQIVPTVQIVAFPPVWSTSVASTVRVKFASPLPGTLRIDLLDENSTRRGGGIATIADGDGLMDMSVVADPGISNGTYRLECLLLHAVPPNESIVARSKIETVEIVAEGKDAIFTLPDPAAAPVGEVLRFSVAYSATADRDLHVDLFNASRIFVNGAVLRVPSGSGLRDMTISYPGALPGNYFITTFITAPTQTWQQALDWGPEQPVFLFPPEYLPWVDSHWGVALATDQVYPQNDADKDGAANWAEFLALTNPRNSTDYLKLEIKRAESGSTLSWRSVATRNYQIFHASELTLGAWGPLPGLIPGTGGSLHVAIDPVIQGPRQFFRLQVLKP